MGEVKLLLISTVSQIYKKLFKHSQDRNNI